MGDLISNVQQKREGQIPLMRRDQVLRHHREPLQSPLAPVD